MFAAVIKLLTFAAFAVHAVFGCCVHHHHHLHSDACGVAAVKSSHSTADASDDATHHHDDACCNHEHDSQSSDEDPAHSPCDGSHDCKEPQCSFVAMPANSLDALVSPPQAKSFVDGLLTKHQPDFRDKAVLNCRFEISSPPVSGRARCVHLQSWQI